MALTKITKTGITNSAVDNNKIEADAVDATKIADNAISEEHLDATAITGNTELAEGAASGDTVLIYDTSAGVLKKITQTNLLNFPTISSVSPTSVTSGDGTGNYTFTITGSGFTGASASLVNDSGTGIAFDTVTVDSSTQITGVIAKSSLPGSGEPYDVKVTAGSGLASTLENQINIDQSPTFNTASGSLGSMIEGGTYNFEIEAYDPESAGNVTFEIQSGSIPAGLSTSTVHENGVSKFIVGGTASVVGSDTTSTFTVRASDAASNTSSRQFSITIANSGVTSFTSSGTFTVPNGLSSVDVLVVAGGGGATTTHSGGGGAGGLIYMPGFPVSAGTITVTVGCGGTGIGTSPAPATPAYGNSGQNSSFGSPGDPGLGTGGVLTAIGGGGSGAGGDKPGLSGGSGGGSGYGSSCAGTATQPTQPGNSGAYGFGNPGGNSGAGAPKYGTGGGGGAGSAGASGNNGAAGTPDIPYGGPGGDGRAYTIADGTTPVYYAGGGGGASGNGDGSGSVAPGGQGGGGDGTSATTGGSGTANRGGGGGGSDARTSPNGGGSGGKGIVIVSY
jgi:hypothetical protein